MATDLVPKPLWLNLSATYDQDELRQPWDDIVLEGVSQINDYLVVPKGGSAASPDAGGGSRNQSVDILGLGPAGAWIIGDTTPDTDGTYRQRAGAVTINEALGANASGSTRIDLVILEVLPGSNKTNTRIVAGTPGSGVAPALPSNSLALAEVTCVNGFTVIAAAQIVDRRVRANGHVYEAFPGADVNNIASASWTDVVSLALITTPRDCTVLYEADAKFLNTAAGTPGVSLRIIDTSQSNVVVAGIGERMIGATGTYGQEVTDRFSISKALAAGAHTFKLQAWKNGSGTVNVIKTEPNFTQAATRVAASFR